MESESIVFVVDDDAAVRDALRELLEASGLHVATFASVEEFWAGYLPRRPACLLLDIRMPGVSGLDLQEQLKARGINLPIIVLTGHADVAMATRCLKAGAADLLEKPVDDRKLLASIHECLARDAECHRQERWKAELGDRLACLSARERQVLDLVLQGLPNKTIAMTLGIAQRTVEVHRAQVMKKMQANSLAELVRMVVVCETGRQVAEVVVGADAAQA